MHPLPATDGFRLHLWNLLIRLRPRHEIILVTSPQPGDDVSPDALNQICSSFRPVYDPRGSEFWKRVRREVTTTRTKRPKLVETLLQTGLPGGVRMAVREEQPDVVHLQTGALAALAPELTAPVVLVPLDADDLNAAASIEMANGRVKTWLGAREAKRWRAFEQTAYAHCDAVVVVGERDAAALHALDPRVEPHVVPNGVDTSYFTPPSAPRDRDVVVFHGALSYPPNVDAAIFAARDVLPLVRQRRPKTRLVLVGREPDRRLRELASDHVIVTDEVPDVRPYLQSGSAYLCPMRLGSGIKNKLLEAFACGCPTVATTLATNGMAATNGKELLVGDDAGSLAAALEVVLDDPFREAARLGNAARQHAVSMSWESTAQKFEAIYDGLRSLRDVAS